MSAHCRPRASTQAAARGFVRIAFVIFLSGSGEGLDRHIRNRYTTFVDTYVQLPVLNRYKSKNKAKLAIF
jgi:hypothetical protein